MNVDSLFNLGIQYYEGHGVVKDYQKAFEYFSQAANLNYALAKYYLGEMYASGLGVKANKTLAEEWYTKAVNDYKILAEKGDETAKWQIKSLAEKGISAALNYLISLGKQGNAEVQNQLGYMYFHGHGVAKDEKLGREWYTKAAKQGDLFAQFALEKLA